MGQKAAGKKLRRSKASKGLTPAKAGKRHGAVEPNERAGWPNETKFPFPRFLYTEVRSDRQRQWKGYATACQKARGK